MKPKTFSWESLNVVIIIVMNIGFCSSLSAATITWNDGDPSNHLWNSPNNWDLDRVPDASLSDIAEIRTAPANNPLIDSSVTDAECYLFIIGKASGVESTLDITGGNLYCSYKSNIGRGNNCTGTLNMSGGTVTLTNTCDIGYDVGSSGLLNMSGGTITIGRQLFVGGRGSGVLQITGGEIDGSGEELYIPWDASASGQVYLNGGTMTFGSFFMNANGRMDITKGKLIVEGDHETTIEGYVTNGWITAYDGEGEVIVDYNGTNTTVFASRNFRPEPFMDNYHLEQMNNLEFRLHRPVAKDIVIIFDQPWEGTGGNPTVFMDEGLYRMYYRGGGNEGHITCYAESQDGKTWTKPNLNSIEYNGSTQNNIVFYGEQWGHGGSYAFMPFKDGNPDCQTDAKYKAVTIKETVFPPSGLDPNELAWWNQGWRWALFAFKSADGFNWTPLLNDPILVKGAFDSQNIAFWDPNQNQYACFFAEYRNSEGERDRTGLDVYRQIKMATSTDFVNWTSSKWLDFGNVPIANLTASNIIPVPQAPHIYIGFPHRLISFRKTEAGYPTPGFETRADASSTLFMSSRDQVNWNLWREAYLRGGLQPKRWIRPKSNKSLCWGMIITESDIPGIPDEWSIFANEDYDTDNNICCLRRYAIRPFGFVSIHAPLQGGELITKPFTLEGSKLALNYATSAAGSIRVEIQDSNGVAIPGFTILDSKVHFRDYLEHTIQWNSGNDISSLIGTKIKLRILIKEADLYSMRIL